MPGIGKEGDGVGYEAADDFDYEKGSSESKCYAKTFCRSVM